MASVAKTVKRFADKLVHRKAVEASGGDRAWADQLITETTASQDECDALGEVTDLLLAELGIQSKYLPLAAALTVVGGATARYALTIRSLNAQIRHHQKTHLEALAASERPK
jgi:hypothetical protein